MSGHRNNLGQPIGPPLEPRQACDPPPRSPMVGQWCRLEPLDIDRHARDLFNAYQDTEDSRDWTYLPYGPFESLDDYLAWMKDACLGDDPSFHAIVDLKTGKPAGVASYLRINPRFGVIEVGHIHYTPRLQRTPAATEAMYLMMRRVFDELGYRRYEWKTDALNVRSRSAAERLGFVFEGVFRQATFYKGRNRDTAWYSVLDTEWPQRKQVFETWLDPSNFDSDGRQRYGLSK